MCADPVSTRDLDLVSLAIVPLWAARAVLLPQSATSVPLELTLRLGTSVWSVRHPSRVVLSAAPPSVPPASLTTT